MTDIKQTIDGTIRTIGLFAELSKIKIALLSALSTAAGFMIATDRMSYGIIAPVLGVFFLACGALALNQYQERHTDALMGRTMSRPLPSGRARPIAAVTFSISCIASGFFILLYFVSFRTACAGLFAVFWYNVIYLFIKRKSAFASIPGSIAGAIPPAVGFEAGGGHILDPRLLVLSVFMIIWQVPHFWLIVIKYGKDYEKAKLPSLTCIFTTRQLTRLTFVWIISTALISFTMPLYGIISLRVAAISFLPAALLLLWSMAGLLIFRKREYPGRYDFGIVNAYALMVMLVLVLH